MRILYVSPYPPAQDGIGTYTCAFVGALRSQGHDARVVVPRGMPDSPGEVIGALARGAREAGALRDSIVTWNPHVVHVQFDVAAFGPRTLLLVRWLDMLRRELPAPVIITMHEVTRDTDLLGAVGRMIYRWVAGRCDKIIVHTAAAATALTGRVGVPSAKAAVIPHPSARPPVAGSTPEELRARFHLGNARILLAFGFIHIDKGLDDLVRAFGILRDSATVPLEDVRLVIAGAVRPRRGMFRVFEARDRVHLTRVLRMARRYRLLPNVVLTGYVPDREIVAWFQAADAVVLPYRRTEQSGVAGLARAFGVQVLASTAGGLGEQFKGSPWIFPPRNPECLARVLRAFLSMPPEVSAHVPPQGHPTDLAAIATATVGLYLSARPAVREDLTHAT